MCLKRIVGNPSLSGLFKGIANRFKRWDVVWKLCGRMRACFWPSHFWLEVINYLGWGRESWFSAIDYS